MKHLKLVLGLVLIILVAVGLSACGEAKKTSTNTGLPENTISNDAFKAKFPLEYDGYEATKNDKVDTKYAGSQPRSKFSADKEPLLPILFNGMPFATDYNEDRGHAYAIEDVYKTMRISDKSPGGCLSCKSTAVPTLIAENGDNYWKAGSFKDMQTKGDAMGHSSIGCSTCHDPQTMDLRVTLPMFKKGMEARGIDISKATKNEMRSYVCGQCHSEYYFAKSNNEVTFPWKNGFKGTEMLELYNTEIKASGFVQDFQSNISAAPMLKAQHPDFETFSEGPHGKAGVSCSDCHMQFVLNEGKKISNHQWQSPFNTMKESCSTCHSERDMDDLKKQAEGLQDTYKHALDVAQENSTSAQYYVNKMLTVGADEAKIKEAQENIRNGQWLWDFCAAENSTGFHNPQGSMDNLLRSSEYSNAALNIATEELVKKGVSIDEVKAEVKKAIEAVAAEADTTKKKTKAINEYFPGKQTPAPAAPAAPAK